MANRQRSNYWVNGRIQGALALRIIAHWIIFAFIAAVLTFTMQFLGDPLLSFSEQLSNVWQNQGLFGLVIVLLMPLFIYDTVRLSHRFAGPIVRLRRALQEVADGQQPVRLKFRDGDFWKELADDYNVLIDKGYLQVDSIEPTNQAEAAPESEFEDGEEALTVVTN